MIASFPGKKKPDSINVNSFENLVRTVILLSLHKISALFSPIHHHEIISAPPSGNLDDFIMHSKFEPSTRSEGLRSTKVSSDFRILAQYSLHTKVAMEQQLIHSKLRLHHQGQPIHAESGQSDARLQSQTWHLTAQSGIPTPAEAPIIVLCWNFFTRTQKPIHRPGRRAGVRA